MHFGGDSCSGAVKKIILEHGLISGWKKIKNRFAQCTFAYQQLKNKKEEDDKWYKNCDCTGGVSPCDVKSPSLDCDLPCDCSF